MLNSALRQHLEKHFESFAAGLLAQANSVHPQIKTDLLSNLDERLKAIESTLSLASNEQKSRVTHYLSDVLTTLPDVGIDKIAKTDTENKEPAAASKSRLASISTSELKPTSYEILDGATGYGYDRVFGPYMAGAHTITVEDPFIRYRYQVDNFRRFCALAVSSGTLKKIELKTGKAFGEDLDEPEARGQRPKVIEGYCRLLKPIEGIF